VWKTTSQSAGPQRSAWTEVEDYDPATQKLWISSRLLEQPDSAAWIPRAEANAFEIGGPLYVRSCSRDLCESHRAIDASHFFTGVAKEWGLDKLHRLGVGQGQATLDMFMRWLIPT
jgi:hypothetical protein